MADQDSSLEIVTGYSYLKETKTWVIHSWILDEDVIIETTFIRDSYYGFQLNSQEKEEWTNKLALYGKTG